MARLNDMTVNPPTLEDIEAMALSAMKTIPRALLEQVGAVQFVVADFPDREILDDMGAKSEFDILGLYSGIPFGESGIVGVRQDVDRIFLYRRPILDYWCETGDDLSHVVRHVLVHEIGHHFGLSDDDMERIEAAG